MSKNFPKDWIFNIISIYSLYTSYQTAINPSIDLISTSAQAFSTHVTPTPLSSKAFTNIHLLLHHAALNICTSISLVSACLKSPDDQNCLISANSCLIATLLAVVLVSTGQLQLSYDQLFPPGWCLVHEMEQIHRELWETLVSTTKNEEELTLLLILLIFCPDKEEQLMPDELRKTVEKVQEHWARLAQVHFKQVMGERYRVRLGQLLMMITSVKQMTEIEELRVEMIQVRH